MEVDLNINIFLNSGSEKGEKEREIRSEKLPTGVPLGEGGCLSILLGQGKKFEITWMESAREPAKTADNPRV